MATVCDGCLASLILAEYSKVKASVIFKQGKPCVTCGKPALFVVSELAADKIGA